MFLKIQKKHRMLVVGVSVSLLRQRIWRPKYFILYCIVLYATNTGSP